MSNQSSAARWRWLRVLAALTLLFTQFLGVAQPAQAVSPDIVISQVYGGGGNSGATLRNDFIELFNRGATAVDITGWSVQYASSTGSSWSRTNLTGSIQPGQYYLIQEAAGTGGTVDLPTPNASGSIAMSATSGKVALVTNTTLLTCGAVAGNCFPNAAIRDFVGYGSAATNFEGSGPTPTLSNTTAALRNSNGATDTDNNAADFAAGAPNPRNTPPPLPNLTVNDVSANEGNSGTTSFDFTVSLASPAGAGGVTFDIATADNTATSPSDFTANALTGQTIPAGSSSYNFSVMVNGDTTDEPDETFFVNVTNVTGATVEDGQAQGTILNDDADFCTQTFTPTYQIQGSGLSAAITGNVTTKGVVVGDFEGTASAQGFYIQDLTGDGDAATSDGIFVMTGASNVVSVGDVVRVTGFAHERFNQTTLNGSNSNTDPVPAANIINCGTGAVAATDVSLPFASGTFAERYEGMLVRFPQSLVISEYFNYDQFGEIVLALPLAGEPRPFSGTAIDEPGADANARTLANSLRRITLDDAQSASNPVTLRHPNGNPFSLSNLFRGGDKVQNTVGVLGFDFSLYRIYPTGPADYTSTNPRPVAPEPVGGSLRVAAMNTLNFFLTLDTTVSDSGPGPCGGNANLDCRGADSNQPDEFPRQRTKLLAALAGLQADIIGLNELENTPGVEPLGDPTNGIVAGLNAQLGAGTYSYINTGVIGTDAIRVGLIYKPAVVTPVGAFKVLTSAVDPRFIDTKSRPSLAQTFEVNATGARFTVAVNHLKSKGSACTDVGDPDAGDGQGNCNGTREAAAQALVDWLATDPTGSGDPDFLIMGDLNSYAREDPITAIKAGSDDTAGTGDDYTNLIAQYQGPFAYSYTFDGQAGYLDHALASSSIVAQVTGAADWHINSDEPDVVDYDTSFKPPAQEALYETNPYRSSDHDSLVVGLNPNASPTVDAGGPYNVNEGGSVTVAATGSDPNTGETLTYAWDLDNDGSFETSGQSATFSAATLDGPSSHTIKVRVTDNGSLTAVDEATVNVQNVAPVATTDSATTDEDVAVTIAVLSNDSDVAGDPLSISSVTQGTKGTVTTNANGTVTYTPQSNANGADSFTYTISDGDGDTATATVNITITPVNDPPVTTNDTLTVLEDASATTVNVLANDTDVDGDTLTVTSVTQGSKGAVTLSAGTVTYKPNANANGADSFTYTISDSHGGSATATVNITITPVNDAPVAVNDLATTRRNTAVLIDVLNNDFDVDNDSLIITAVTKGANGNVTIVNGKLRYGPKSGFTGTDTFTYTISDGHGGTATATVTVTVTK